MMETVYMMIKCLQESIKPLLQQEEKRVEGGPLGACDGIREEDSVLCFP